MYKTLALKKSYKNSRNTVKITSKTS